MTTNYHTALPTNSPVTAAAFEDRFSTLDSGITGLASGGGAISAMNVGTDTTLTIAAGIVTRSKTRHLIDTEASASTDDLTTISGGAEGDVLIISAANTARTVVVKHGTGNIWNFSKADISLDDADLTLMYVYDGARWQQMNGLSTQPLTNNSYRVPIGLPLVRNMAAGNRFYVKAAAGTVASSGIAAPTFTGTTTPTASNDTDSTYINLASTNVSGQSAGLTPATYNYFRYSHSPIFRCVLRTGAAASIADIRAFVGITSAAMTNVSTIAGATEAALIRFDTTAGDTGWTIVTKDATTQTLGSVLAAVTASTRYLFDIFMDYANSRVLFSINNGTPVAVTATLPAAATELGISFLLFTNSAVIKNWKLSRIEVEYD